MDRQESDTDQLVRETARGDLSARDALLSRHRDRLNRMVRMRINRDAAARFDASDVVQEALVTANQRLDEYLESNSMPFYPWLRNIAFQQLLNFHDRHVHAQKRSVRREANEELGLNEESILNLADCLAGSITGPSQALERKEVHRRVNEELQSLRPNDRQIIELLYLEQLTTSEVAAVLELSVGAVRARHFRAIQRLTERLQK